MIFKRPDFEIKNATWEIIIEKDKVTIKHRKRGSKLEFPLKDLTSLASLVSSTVLARE